MVASFLALMRRAVIIHLPRCFYCYSAGLEIGINFERKSMMCDFVMRLSCTVDTCVGERISL